MTDSRRVLRVERELKEIMANLLHHGLKTPLPSFASVVDVDVTPDLRSARVFVRVAGGESERAEAEQILAEERGRLQREVGQRLNTKFCPTLRFAIGGAGSGDNDEIEQLLVRLNHSRSC